MTITANDKSKLPKLNESGENLKAHETCPLCGWDDRETISENPAIVRCLRCHHGFRPDSQDSIARSYSGPVNMPSYFEAVMFARHHYDFIERNIGFENISSIMEIGSGDGALMKMIRKKHDRIQLVAIEPSGELCRGLEKIPDLAVVNSYIEEYSPVSKFDLVIMSHVLEHLEKPLEVLKLIHDNYLNPGGYLYIDIPNQDFELRTGAMALMAPVTHLFFFNGQYFQNILAQAGFPLENISGAKYSTIPGDYTTRMEIISGLGKSGGVFKRIKLFREKAMKKISLQTSAPMKVLLNRQPDEIPLEEMNDNYNNMAIIVRK